MAPAATRSALFDANGNRITGVSFGAATVGATFDNAAGLGSSTEPLPAVATLSVVGVNGAFNAVDGHGRGSPGRIANPIVLPALAVTEVVPWGSGNGNTPYGADWFEVTNKGATPVVITGFKMDDDSGNFATAVALTGITTIAPGESVIFIETADLATTKAAFLTAWFGANVPAGLQVGAYSGSGVGLGNGGDAVNLFDCRAVIASRASAWRRRRRASRSTTPRALGATAPPLPVVDTLSVVGVNGAFLAADGRRDADRRDGSSRLTRRRRC